jgi:uncharacterized protein (DUF2141 family)
MMRAYSPLSVGVSFSLLSASAFADRPPDSRSTVVVRVGPLRNANGSLGCRLHPSGEGFPMDATGTVTRRVKLDGTTARCDFENVAPGTYAVVVHHDENDNKKFDKNLLGVPLEGYGVSNNRTYALSAPRWAESKFVVGRGTNPKLAISVRY